jgi:uncharacterized Rmd1/YagE family protein
MAAAKAGAKPEARLPRGQPIAVHAALIGERIELRGLFEPPEQTGIGPLAMPIGAAGLAMLFRYGAVVLFNASEAERKEFLKELKPRIQRPLARPETEEAVVFDAGRQPEGITAEGIGLGDLSLPRLQIVATLLTRSVALAYYESTVAGAFDLIEPLALKLEQPRGSRHLKPLVRQIGAALLVQHKLIGRVEIQDRPDILWDHPELERLYLRLENEYELVERNTVLERKLALIARTVEAAVNLLQNQRLLRVEWYIVILIVASVLLSLYAMFPVQ